MVKDVEGICHMSYVMYVKLRDDLKNMYVCVPRRYVPDLCIPRCTRKCNVCILYCYIVMLRVHSWIAHVRNFHCQEFPKQTKIVTYL